jgi:hypothetical protein
MRERLVLLILLILTVPDVTTGQDLGFIENVVAPRCQESIIKLRKVSQADSLSEDEMRAAYRHAVAYYELDVEGGCNSPGRFESEYISEAILKSNNPDYVAFFVDYLKATSGSADESRSSGLEKIFARFPRVVIRLAKKETEDVRHSLAHHIAWGYLNNTYPAHKKDPVGMFWTRYSSLDEKEMKDAPFIRKVIEQIRTYSQRG